MTEFQEITSDLRFPEGPIAMADGSVLLVEIARGTLSRVTPDGAISVVAETGGGPNGAAIGPDGACYICNNGGFEWRERHGMLHPVRQADDYDGGRIERVDLDTGEVTVLYTGTEEGRLSGPNDIVFDGDGGFWFTDIGKRRDRDQDHGGVYYGRADGSLIKQVIYPMVMPNGIALSPDDSRLYVAETITGRLWAFDVAGPGEIDRRPWPAPYGGELVCGVPGYQLFDSMAVDAAGNVCVATIWNGGITVAAPDGSNVEHIALPDAYTTNICFGGPGLTTAYVTLSGSGRLVSMDWPRPGLALHYLNK